jgi:hypothetical protein
MGGGKDEGDIGTNRAENDGTSRIGSSVHTWGEAMKVTEERGPNVEDVVFGVRPLSFHTEILSLLEILQCQTRMQLIEPIPTPNVIN